MENTTGILIGINAVFFVLAVLGLIAVVYSLESLYRIVKKKFAPNPDKRVFAYIRLGVCAVYGVLVLAVGTSLVTRFVTLPVADYLGNSIVIDGHRFIEVTGDAPEEVRLPGTLYLERVARDQSPPGAGIMALFNIPFYARSGEDWPPEFIFYDHRPWRIFQHESLVDINGTLW